MAAVQKHIIHVKHVFKQYNILNDTCRFHTTAGPGTRVSFIRVAQYSPYHKALTCKRYNRVKSRVSNKRTEAKIMSNVLLPAFENKLVERKITVSPVCYLDTHLSWAINLYMTC